MKKVSIIAFALLVAAVSAEAKSWKVGPSSVVGMDFASINDAMSKVTNGDTLYLDQYYNESAEQTVTKKVTIIGTGYDDSLNDEQVVARLTKSLTLKANNVTVKSVRIEGDVNFYSTDCIIDRCYISGLIKHQSTTAGMNHLYSCYITGRIEGYSSKSPSMQDIQNCVIVNNETASPAIYNIVYLTASIINNNVIVKSYKHNLDSQFGYSYCLSSISNSQITNNMVYGYNSNHPSYYNRDFTSDVVASGSGNTIDHNIFSGTADLTYYPSNKTGQRDNWNSIFVCSGSYSDYYKLATDSGDNPAVGYARDGGDVGCHGGMFGCPSGGRPQYIPYFTKVTVGSRTEGGKLPVNVSIKIQDK